MIWQNPGDFRLCLCCELKIQLKTMGMALLGKNKQIPNPFCQESPRAREMGTWKLDGEEDLK